MSVRAAAGLDEILRRMGPRGRREERQQQQLDHSRTSQRDEASVRAVEGSEKSGSWVEAGRLTAGCAVYGAFGTAVAIFGTNYLVGALFNSVTYAVEQLARPFFRKVDQEYKTNI